MIVSSFIEQTDKSQPVTQSMPHHCSRPIGLRSILSKSAYRIRYGFVDRLIK